MYSYKVINAEFPELNNAGYREGNRITFSFQGAEYEYIDINSFIHAFSLDLNDEVDINYLGKNAIIDYVEFTSLTGEPIFKISDYYTLYPFIQLLTIDKNIQLGVEAPYFLGNYSGLIGQTDKQQFMDYMKFSLEKKLWLQKNFKMEIYLNTKNRTLVGNTAKITDLRDYKYTFGKIYYKGSNTKQTEEKGTVLTLKRMRIGGQKNVKFSFDNVGKHSFIFLQNWNDIHNVERYRNADSQLVNNSRDRLYYNTSTRQYDIPVISQYNQNTEHPLQSFQGQGSTKRDYDRHFHYIIPESIRIKSPDIDMNYYKLYINQNENNINLHTLDLIENINDNFNINILDNLNKCKIFLYPMHELSTIILQQQNFFTYINGDHPYLDVEISRPIQKGDNYGDPADDNIYFLTTRDLK